MENSDDIRHHYQYQGSCYILWVTIVIKGVSLEKIIDQIIVVSYICLQGIKNQIDQIQQNKAIVHSKESTIGTSVSNTVHVYFCEMFNGTLFSFYITIEINRPTFFV